MSAPFDSYHVAQIGVPLHNQPQFNVWLRRQPPQDLIVDPGTPHGMASQIDDVLIYLPTPDLNSGPLAFAAYALSLIAADLRRLEVVPVRVLFKKARKCPFD